MLKHLNTKDIIYITVFLALIILIVALFWNISRLSTQLNLLSLTNNINEDNFNIILEPLFVQEASKFGLYNSPQVYLFGDKPGMVNLVIKNRFQTPLNFTVEVIPNPNITDPYVPYEGISLDYTDIVFINSSSHIISNILVSTNLYDFDQPSRERPLPQYFVRVKVENSTYAVGNFTVLAIPQSAIDEL